MKEERRCPVCSSTNWSTLLESATGTIMTGDQRIGAGNLKKIQCDLCGVGANADEFSEAEIETQIGRAHV